MKNRIIGHLILFLHCYHDFDVFWNRGEHRYRHVWHGHLRSNWTRCCRRHCITGISLEWEGMVFRILRRLVTIKGWCFGFLGRGRGSSPQRQLGHAKTFRPKSVEAIRAMLPKCACRLARPLGRVLPWCPRMQGCCVGGRWGAMGPAWHRL